MIEVSQRLFKSNKEQTHLKVRRGDGWELEPLVAYLECHAGSLGGTPQNP
jgi:hypothetical protein